MKWMEEVRDANPEIKFVPRVILDSWSYAELIALLTHTKLPAFIGKQLAQCAEKWKFDGFVLEIWWAVLFIHFCFRWSVSGQMANWISCVLFFSTRNAFAAQQKLDLAKIIIKISAFLKKNNLEFILVVPPPLYYGSFVHLVEWLREWLIFCYCYL